MLRGWALAEQGQGEEGITQIHQGLAAHRALGAELALTWFLSMLAKAYWAGSQSEDVLHVLTEALDAVDKRGERAYEAELYRLKGELTLAQSSVQRLASSVQTNQKAKACPELSRRGKRQKAKITNPQLLTPNPQTEAEEYFWKAIEIARRQHAKSLELRAVMSLSRLWQQQGKKEEARKMLAEIYNWFTEGFDTVDLKEAKALLEQIT